MTKVYCVYVEIIAKGDNEEQVKGGIEDALDESFGAENYTTFQVQELTLDEIIELENGFIGGDDEDDEVVGANVIDINTEKELDEMDIKRDEMVSDELGS